MSEQDPSSEDRAVDDAGREFIARRHYFPANGPGFLLTPVVWFAYFLAVYALQGAGCAAGLHARTVLGVDALRLALLFLTLLAVAVILGAGLWSYQAWQRLLRDLEREERQVPGHSAFLAYGALLHAALFLVATLWIGLPILLLPTCGGFGG
ncbi:MAG: hypothetical protein ACODAC_10810 [Pseudomonadota bacterium]